MPYCQHLIPNPISELKVLTVTKNMTLSSYLLVSSQKINHKNKKKTMYIESWAVEIRDRIFLLILKVISKLSFLLCIQGLV